MMRALQIVQLVALGVAASVCHATAQERATVPGVIERAKTVGENLAAPRIALEYLAGQVEQVITRLGEIEAQNQALRSERAILKWQLGEMTEAHRALEKNLTATNKSQAQQLAALRDHLTALTEELNSERGIRDALQTESSALEQQLGEMTTARTALEREVESTEQRASNQLQALQQQLAALTVELESEHAVRDALARHRTTLADTVAALHRERASLAGNLASARNTIGRRTTEINRQQAEISLLSDQVAALRADLKEFKDALAAAQIRTTDQEKNIEELGRRLNAALAARVRELAKYRSEFFGRLRDVLGDRADVRVVGDRFVLQSELLFASGSARIGEEGKRELGELAAAIERLAALIPDDVDWILRIDGHTDRIPIITEHFSSNWDLSTARAVSVVEFLVSQGISPRRLAATGFGEFQPIDDRRDEIAYRRNRRIEFKLTQR